MGSGYFPFGQSDEKTEKLKKAISLIEEVREEISDDIYCGADGQFDNAASDGGYLRQLGIAITLIAQCYIREA